MGCTAVTFQLYHLTSVPLFCFLLFFGSFSFQTQLLKAYPSQPIWNTIFSVKPSLITLVKDLSFEPLELFIAISSLHKCQVWAIYGSDNGCILSRYFLSPHKELSPLSKMRKPKLRKAECFPFIIVLRIKFENRTLRPCCFYWLVCYVTLIKRNKWIVNFCLNVFLVDFSAFK